MTRSLERLGELASFASGGTPDKKRPEYYDGGSIPWLTGADIVDGEVRAARSYVTELGIERSAASVAAPGTILLVTRTGVGKVAIAPRAVSFSQDITAVGIEDSRLDVRYVAQVLQARRQWLEARARGATIRGVTREVVAGIPVPVPPIEEQRRIAQSLEVTQAIRARRRQTLEALARLRRATFARAVADPSWPRVQVLDLVDRERGGIRTGPFGSQLLHSEFVDAGVAVLGIDNAVENEFRMGSRRYISEGKYEQLRRYTVHSGDVLITIMGTCGRAAVVPDNIGRAINTKHLCCITLDHAKCLPTFLHAYFLFHPVARQYLMARANGAVMSGLNMAIIKQLPVLLPPIELQAKLVNQLVQLDRVRARATAHEARLDSLYASLQQQAFGDEF